MDPMIASVGEHTPQIDDGAFLAPGSYVLGQVTIGPAAGIWYGTVLRAEFDPITVGAQTNLQDGCVVHTDIGFPASIGERVSVGHRAVLHGCTIEDDVLVGMSATVLNGAHIGSYSLIAAGAVVLQGAQIPGGSLVAGVPAKVIRELTEDERGMIEANAAVYLELAEQHRAARPA